MPFELSDQRLVPSNIIEADEGKYFVATNQPGTPIAQSIQTSFSATNALCTIFNSASASTFKRIYLDYMRLIVGTAGASATSCELAVALDIVNRYSSGGSAITPVCPNADVQNNSIATVNFGAVTATAATSQRIASRITIKNSIQVAKDSYFIKFNVVDGQGSTTGTPVVVGHSAGPVIAGPGGTIVLHVWNPANATTAPTYEFEIGWFER